MLNLRCTILLTLTFSLTSCSQKEVVTIQSQENEFVQNETINPKMDILWVVDNSGSMRQEIDNVINNINAFVGVYKDKGYDFHMGAVSTSAWSLESYKEFKDYQDCMAAGGDTSACVAPENNEDRSYLIHPDDGVDVFGRLHMGECLGNNNPLSTGIPYITSETPNLTDVFSSNFNVYGDHLNGNCGTDASLSPTNGTTNARYTPFIHEYYHGTKDLNATTPHYGSSERGRLFAYVGDERPLQSMRAFLELSPDVQSFLRPEAFLAVILITDESDHSRPSLRAVNGPGGTDDVVEDYVNRINNLKGSEDLFKAYVITQTSNRPRLQLMASASGGLSLNINGTEADYLENLLTITGNIVQSSTSFKLNCEPKIESISVRFDVPDGNGGFTEVEVPRKTTEVAEGWSYIPGNLSLIFSEDYFPESGTKVRVNYDPTNLNCNKNK